MGFLTNVKVFFTDISEFLLDVSVDAKKSSEALVVVSAAMQHEARMWQWKVELERIAKQETAIRDEAFELMKDAGLNITLSSLDRRS
jgi:hypothetical protein